MMTRRHGWLFGCFTALSLFGPAAAESVSANETEVHLRRSVGTLSVSAQPVRREGQLTGCQLVFAALHVDNIYRNGGLMKVLGSASMMRFDEKLSGALKVVVSELVISDSMKLVPSPPSRAYIIAKDQSTNLGSLIKSVPSETAGAIFQMFEASPTTEMLVDAISENALTIAFNSRNGATDMPLRLELDVEDRADTGEVKRSDRMKQEFMSCATALIDAAEAAMAKTHTGELP